MSREAGGGQRVLVISHASGVEDAVGAVSALAISHAPDVLPLGRGAGQKPEPSRGALVAPPVIGGSRLRGVVGLAAWLRRLRRRRYHRVVIALPDVRVNQSRGALFGLALATGAREASALDPQRRMATPPLTRGEMLEEGFRFTALSAVGTVVSALAGALISAFSRIASKDVGAAPMIDTEGRVIYLRTDVELALAPLRAGGSLSHTLGILSALRRRGHEVELLTTGEIDSASNQVVERRLPVTIEGNIPRELCELISGLRQGFGRLPPGPRPAFVYQRHSMNNLAGVLMARRWRVPLVLEANASEVQWREEWSSLRLPALGRACERLILGEAARVAAVSENAARHLLDAGAPPPRLRVIPNGVEVERFASAFPRELPFDDDAFLIGFTGLFYPWHGVRHLAEAFVALSDRRSDARLLLVGDGEDAGVVRDMLERAGVMDRVLMTGLVPSADVPGYLQRCDALASPHAATDGFIGSPIKIWEYMASGRPIVASDLAQMGDVLEHERTALLVPQADPQALVDAIIRLADDRELSRRLGRAAQAEAREKHSWDARLEQTLE